jgi:hypothetical protein
MVTPAPKWVRRRCWRPRRSASGKKPASMIASDKGSRCSSSSSRSSPRASSTGRSSFVGADLDRFAERPARVGEFFVVGHQPSALEPFEPGVHVGVGLSAAGGALTGGEPPPTFSVNSKTSTASTPPTARTVDETQPEHALGRLLRSRVGRRRPCPHRLVIGRHLREVREVRDLHRSAVGAGTAEVSAGLHALAGSSPPRRLAGWQSASARSNVSVWLVGLGVVWWPRRRR